MGCNTGCNGNMGIGKDQKRVSSPRSSRCFDLRTSCLAFRSGFKSGFMMLHVASLTSESRYVKMMLRGWKNTSGIAQQTALEADSSQGSLSVPFKARLKCQGAPQDLSCTILHLKVSKCVTCKMSLQDVLRICQPSSTCVPTFARGAVRDFISWICNKTPQDSEKLRDSRIVKDCQGLSRICRFPVTNAGLRDLRRSAKICRGPFSMPRRSARSYLGRGASTPTSPSGARQQGIRYEDNTNILAPALSRISS